MPPRPYYSAFMLLSLAVFVIARQLLPKTPGLSRLTWRQRTALGLAAFIGGALGAKLPFIDTDAGWLTGIWFRDGKTLTTGLIGGYLGVELAKLALDIRLKTGDSFALPLALALAVGRWGCFCNHCCFGRETCLPWGVDFGDGVCRHPTQIYESLFHLVMAVFLWQLWRRGMWGEQRLKAYLIAYCVFRFGCEFIRPEAAWAAGLTFYQVVVALFAAALVCQWAWDGQRSCRFHRGVAEVARLQGASPGTLASSATGSSRCKRDML